MYFIKKKSINHLIFQLMHTNCKALGDWCVIINSH